MRLRMMSSRGKERNGHGRWQKIRNWFPPDRKWEQWCGFWEELEMCPGKVARPPQWLHGLSARLGSKSSGLWQKFSCPRIARNRKAVLLQGTSLRKGDTCNHSITSWKLNTQLYLRCHLDSWNSHEAQEVERMRCLPISEALSHHLVEMQTQADLSRSKIEIRGTPLAVQWLRSMCSQGRGPRFDPWLGN